MSKKAGKHVPNITWELLSNSILPPQHDAPTICCVADVLYWAMPLGKDYAFSWIYNTLLITTTILNLFEPYENKLVIFKHKPI